ncbi:Sec-independent protein translocase protein TatB [Phenylobacterium sp.]|uniref:Sec-independent protein translocase protein TatB n=1 Tax=Phenylobacterium sp. TaxID=1871053 RepID=UPI003BAB28E1
MLPEVGGMELLVIAAVALIVVGPKDLPMLLRKLGQFVARLRSMADDFRASFDEMARQSELDDLRKEVEAMRRGQLVDQAAAEASNVEINQVFNEIGDSLQGSGIQFHPPMSHQYGEAEGAEGATSEPVVAKPKAPRKPRAPTAATTKPKAAPKKKPATVAAARRAPKGTVS